MGKRLVIWALPLLISIQSCEIKRPIKTITEEEKVRQERQAQDNARRDEIIVSLKNAYAADDTWQNGVKTNTWTVDLQDRILGNSIVASGFLVDVWRGKDGNHYLRFLDEPFWVRAMISFSRVLNRSNRFPRRGVFQSTSLWLKFSQSKRTQELGGKN
jgi:hypothetical protein